MIEPTYVIMQGIDSPILITTGPRSIMRSLLKSKSVTRIVEEPEIYNDIQVDYDRSMETQVSKTGGFTAYDSEGKPVVFIPMHSVIYAGFDPERIIE